MCVPRANKFCFAFFPEMDPKTDVFFNAVKSAQATGIPKETVGTLLRPDVALFEFNQFAAQTHANNAKVTTGELFTVPQSMGAALEHLSFPPLHTLRPVTLRQLALHVNTIANGCVLCAQLCGASAFRVSPALATNFVVCDADGNMVMASIYNRVPMDQQPTRVFPDRSYVAILDPYMKFPRDDPRYPPMLRCDHPMGVTVFRNKSQWLLAQGISVPASVMQQHSQSVETIRARATDGRGYIRLH